MHLEYLGLIELGFILLPGLAGDRPKTFAVPSAHTATDRAPYAQWKYGPPATPNYFPIAVWLQSPENALKYKAAGFNLYVGLWQGPTEEQLSASGPPICR